MIPPEAATKDRRGKPKRNLCFDVSRVNRCPGIPHLEASSGGRTERPWTGRSSRRHDIARDPELDPRAAVQHARLVDLTDQLLVRTGEMAHRQEEGPNRKIFGAMARYLPALSGMRLL